jgi:hypothetical protein
MHQTQLANFRTRLTTVVCRIELNDWELGESSRWIPQRVARMARSLLDRANGRLPTVLAQWLYDRRVGSQIFGSGRRRADRDTSTLTRDQSILVMNLDREFRVERVAPLILRIG